MCICACVLWGVHVNVLLFICLWYVCKLQEYMCVHVHTCVCTWVYVSVSWLLLPLIFDDVQKKIQSYLAYTFNTLKVELKRSTFFTKQIKKYIIEKNKEKEKTRSKVLAILAKTTLG